MDSRVTDKTFIICNPAAGEGLAAKRWDKFRYQLEQGNHPFEFQLTESPTHATEIATILVKDGFKRIAVFGGDGTVNETIQGLVQFGQQVTSELQLVYFPAGSSCDFAKKFPDGRSMVERFLSKSSTLIDVCLVECKDSLGQDTSRYFINNSSIGVISAANNKYNNVTGFSKFVKRLTVDGAAIMAGVSAIMEFEPVNCKVKTDEHEWETNGITNMTAFKTPYFGGGMNYGINCNQDDGLMDVVLVDAVSKIKLLNMIIALYTGNILNKDEAHHRRCKSLLFESDDDICIETDGEIGGYPPAEFSVLKQAIRVVL